uniref:Uncharacterized protein n=1 Tax=Eutreptiella gymnastica TaxID=73025 RepID=A0A7S1N2L4_9EUGL
MSTTQLVQDILDSDEGFRKQFDKNDPSYHGGDTTVVRTGGASVPKGMEAHANWQDLPETAPAAPVDYGPEVARLMALRSNYDQLKKTMTGLPMAVDLISKGSQKLKTDPLVNTDDARAKIEEQIKQDEAKRDKAIADIKSVMEPITDPDMDEMKATIQELIDQSMGAREMDKEKCFDWASAIKRVQQTIFAQMKKLLQDIKDEKKKATAK